MSKQIENNVVKMSFDNKDFEKNISTSTKSIQQLNKELEFKDADKGFQNLEKYANSVNFDGLNKAIDNINSVFTITGSLCKKVIDDIAGYFEKKIVSAVSYVKDQATSIFDIKGANDKYKQFTTGMSTLVANMTDLDKLRYKADHDAGFVADELEYIENYASKLATFADETSYSFSDMFETIAKYSSSNVDLNRATEATIGLANAAAVAGQNAKIATSSFQQVAQAFGRGYVMYQDYYQAFGSKNIGTYEFKKTMVEAANKLGVLKDEVLEDIKKEHPTNWIDILFSSDQLNQGWLTIDVLNTGLNEYSKATTYLLNNIDNLTDGYELTFSNMLGAVKAYKEAKDEAVEAGEDFKTIDFVKGLAEENEDWKININEMSKALETLASEEYELSLKSLEAAQQANYFEEAMDSLRDAFATQFMYIMKAFIGDLYQARELWASFGDSLYEVFINPLFDVRDAFEAWNQGFVETEDGLQELEYNYETFWASVGHIFTALGEIFSGFVDQIKFALGLFERAEDGSIETLGFLESYTLSFLESVSGGLEKISNFLDYVLHSDTYANLRDAVLNIAYGIISLKKALFKVLGSTLLVVLKNIEEPLNEISYLIVQITWGFTNFITKVTQGGNFEKLLNTISKITAKLMELVTKVLQLLNKVVGKLIDKILIIVDKLGAKLVPIIDWIVDAVDKYLIPGIDYLIDGEFGIAAGLDWLSDKFKIAIGWIKDFSTNVLGISFDKAKEKIADFTDFIKVKLSGGSGGIFDILFGFIGETFNSDTPGTFGYLINEIAEANSIAEAASSTISWTGDALMRPIQLILDLAGELIGVDLSGLATAISEFVHSFTDSLAGITPDVLSLIERVGGILISVLSFVAGIIKSIFLYLAGSNESTGFALLDGILNSIKTILMVVVDVFSFILEKLAKVAVYMTPVIMQVIDWMGIFIEKLANMIVDMVKQFATVKDGDELLGHLWRMFKFFLGFLLIMQLLSVLTGITNLVNKLSNTANILSGAAESLTGGLNKAVNSLFGNNMAGMLRTFALLLFAFGYALSKVIEAGNALADPEKQQGMVTAITAMIALILIVTAAAILLFKTQTSAYSRLEKAKKAKEKAQERWEKSYYYGKRRSKLYSMFFEKKDLETIKKDNSNLEEEAKAVKDSLADTAKVMVALALGVILISKSISILAKASKETSPEDMKAAAATVASIILMLGVFLKLTKSMQKTTKEYDKINGGFNKSKSGLFNNSKSKGISTEQSKESFEGSGYGGVAGVLLSLAVAVMLITIPIKMLAKAMADKDIGGENVLKAFGIVMGVFLIVGGIAVALVKVNHDVKDAEADTVKAVLNRIIILTLILAAAVSAISAALSKANLDAEGQKTIRTVFIALGSILVVIGLIAVLITAFSKSKDVQEIASGNNLFTTGDINVKFMGAFFSVGVFIASFGLAVYLIMKAIESASALSDDGTPYYLLAAVASIIAIIAVVALLIKSISKSLSEDSGNDAAVIGAKMAGMIGIIWTITGMITTLAAVIVGLVLALKILAKDEDYSVFGYAMLILTGMFALVVLFVSVMAAIANKLGDGKSSPAESMLAMAGAMLVLNLAIISLSLGLIAIAVAIKDIPWQDLLAAGLVMAGAIALMVVAGLACKVLGGGLEVLTKAALGLVLVVLAGLAVIGLAMLIGDQVIDWMNNNTGKIFEFFYAIGQGLMEALLGLLTALTEYAPLLIGAIMDLILVVIEALTKWFANNPDFGFKLGELIWELIKAIAKAITVVAVKAAQTLWEAIKKIWESIINFFKDLFGIHSPSTWFKEMGGYMMDGLLSGLQAGVDAVLNFFSNLWGMIRDGYNNLVDDVSVGIFGDPQKENEEKLKQQHVEQDIGVRRVKEKGIGINAQKAIRILRDLEHGVYKTENEITKAQSELDSLIGKGSYVYKQFMNASMYEAEYMVNEMKEMGYNTSAGFLWGLRNGGDPYAIGKQYMTGVIDGGKDAAQIKSPSKVFAYMGSMLSAGLESTFNASTGEEAGIEYSSALIEGFQDTAGIHSKSKAMEYCGEMLSEGVESGFNSDIGKSLGSTVADSISGGWASKLGMLKGLFTGDGLNLGSILGDSFSTGLTDSLDISSLNESMNIEGLDLELGSVNMGFDTSSMNLDTSSLNMNMPSYDSMSFDTGYTQIDDINDLGSSDYGANWNVIDSPSSTSQQLAYSASQSMEATNAETNQLLRELNDNLIAWREASSKTAIYINDDVLVGEIVEPLDKELGRRAQLNAKRGI